MVGRERLDRIRARLAALEDGAVDAELAADLAWLLDEVERLAEDNQRLSRLVGDITEMVRDAKRRRLVPVTDTIDDALARERGDDGDGDGDGDGDAD